MIIHPSGRTLRARPPAVFGSSISLAGVAHATFETSHFITTNPAWSSIVGNRLPVPLAHRHATNPNAARIWLAQSGFDTALRSQLFAGHR